MNPVRLVLSKPFDKIPHGASRFWGNPDLPEGTPYPMYIDDEGDEYPYFFVCQINLQDLAVFAPDVPLPKTGLLSFFAKIDHYLGRFAATYGLAGYVSDPDDVRVIFTPDTSDLHEVILVDDDDEPTSPAEMAISFTRSPEPLSDEHELFANPTHREWETWEHPFEDWDILLQVDSFDGMDFQLNFMDCGVLDFLISPKALAEADFSGVRGIILST